MRTYPFLLGMFQNIIEAGSAILHPGTKPHWEHIQRSEGGTAHLLHSFEDYTHTLVQNMKNTYLKPFTIVTDNMSEYTHTHTHTHTHCR